MTEKNKTAILEKYSGERNTCQQWTRVMGYYRPTASFNLGKQSEAKERVYFTTSCCCSH